MKKAIVILLFTAMAAVLCSVLPAVWAAESALAAEYAWTAGSGLAAESAWAAEGCTAAETADGTVFTGSGEDFRMACNERIPLGKFSLDIELGQVPQEGTAQIRIALQGESAEAFVLLTLSELSYSAEFDFGSAGKQEFVGLTYRGEHKVQLRIAQEGVLNFNTGVKENKWAVRSNNSPDSASILSDESAAAQFLSDRGGELVTCSAEADASVGSVRIRSLGGLCFYEYVTVSDGIAVTDGTLSYERLTLEWTLPEEISAGSLLLERYCGGERQFSGSFSGMVYGYNDSGLTQGETYTYILTGYDSQENGVTLCPKILFRFDPLTVQTKAGNPVPIVLAIVFGIVFIAAVILLYAAWPTISEKIRGRRKQHG